MPLLIEKMQRKTLKRAPNTALRLTYVRERKLAVPPPLSIIPRLARQVMYKCKDLAGSKIRMNSVGRSGWLSQCGFTLGSCTSKVQRHWPILGNLASQHEDLSVPQKSDSQKNRCVFKTQNTKSLPKGHRSLCRRRSPAKGVWQKSDEKKWQKRQKSDQKVTKSVPKIKKVTKLLLRTSFCGTLSRNRKNRQKIKENSLWLFWVAE